MIYDKNLLDYINTALWSTELDDNYSIGDFDKETLETLKIELFDFIEKYSHLMNENDRTPGMDNFVHNFWLTRNGHGAGFWDGDYVNGDKLTEASENYKEINLYIGDDRKVYVS